MNLLDKARKTINKTDKKTAKLFETRMTAVKDVLEYKKENGLPVFDEAREKEVLKRNAEYIKDAALEEYYLDFLKSCMDISKKYQYSLLEDGEKKDGVTTLKSSVGPYDIKIGRGLLERAGEFLNLNRRVIIVTDEGVPKEYAEKILKASTFGEILTLPEGEGTKSFEYFELLLTKMLDFGLTRTDCLVAVGGGVIGDLTGFAAASYMRGIDFYNVPTTLLSEVDSSIGGKCAINLSSTKNTVGAFYQPKAVICDLDTLKTLDKRLVAEGLAEALKMALTSDAELFRIFENEEITDGILEEIVTRSLKIKLSVVTRDEKESGLRKILNFGHTYGHGIEAESFGKLYHGECVALGMIPMVSKELRPRLIQVLEKLNLPTKVDIDVDKALAHVANDKKADGDKVSAIFVSAPAKYEIRKIKISEFCDYIKKNV